MRIHRLVLRDYRGVSNCALAFAERGVTVVEGDNEVGKSSAAEALHLLIEYRDDSTHRDVKAVRPLHRDAGAEVEVELSAGPHRLVYAKRWHKERYTRLKVLGPAPEVLTGRDAHDRVRHLLAETVDLDLWRALSTPQGDGLRQRALRHPSLVAALEDAGGGDLGAGDGDDLVERAAQEARRWFTATGRPRAALAEVGRAADEARADVARWAGALGQLEVDIAWHADLQRSAADLAEKLAAATNDANAAAAHLASIDQRRGDVQVLDVASRLAASEATVAAAAVTGRTALVARVAVTTSATASAIAAVSAAAAVVSDTEAALADAGAVATRAGAATDEAQADAQAAAAAYGRQRHLATLAEIDARLAAAEREQRALEKVLVALADNRSTPDAVLALQASHEAVLGAEAAMAAGQATVSLHAHRDIAVVVDGSERELGAGAVEERDVVGSISVDVPGAVTVTVTAGADARAVFDRLARARAELGARCAALGVDDLAGALALEQERRDLTAEVASRRAALARAVGGATLEELAARASAVRDALGVADGCVPVPTPASLEAAGADVESAGERLRATDRAAATAQAAATSAHDRCTVAAAAAESAAAEAKAAASDHAAAERAFAEARVLATDEALEAAAVAAQRTAVEAAHARRVAADALEALDPTDCADAARRTARERDGADAALREVREDLAKARGRFEAQSEAGLHDRLAAAEQLAAAADEERATVEARANAAQLLFTTLTRYRDDAVRAYGAPLRAGIESLGRHVFGDGFAVQLDDDLRVAARELDGVPVPWADLSVGAREQLGILARLAAATLVSPSGGVPVVFDDVLGFTDPGRLAGVARAFEAAAEHCQIIVLTCDPQRYRHLARATTHCLAAPRTLDAREAG